MLDNTLVRNARVALLPGTGKTARAISEEIAQLRTSNATFSEHQQRLRDQLAEARLTLEVAHAGTFSIDLATGAISWSDKLHRLYGLKPGEFGGRIEDWLEFVLPEDRSKALAEYQSNVECTSTNSSEFRIRRRNDGELRWLKARGQVLFDSEKRPWRMVGVHADVTERLRAKEEIRALKEQFRHAQKMEAVGHLAGGVAHDFNNLLMVIRSFAELLQVRLPAAAEDLHRYTQEILNASARAAGLTTQLLAFSRKQILNPTILDLKTVTNDTTKMLKRLIGENIEVQVLADEPLWPIRADVDQIVQVLMNLCVNARDAMPQGGTITIQIRNGRGGERGPANAVYVVPGAYVVLSVEDTGIGISEKDLEHVFDPFFTTKPVGRGTGLGLSTVYGIVKQSKGYVWANSELGKGTRFTIYFPRTEDVVVPSSVTPKTADPPGIGTVLVVEDETTIREVICEFLGQRGYTVLPADSGEQALLIAGRHAGTIDLLISDLVLPRLCGRELSRMLIELRPEMKVIYMSGQVDRPELNIHGHEHMQTLLQKPFSLSKLAQAMRDVLNQTEGSNYEGRSA
jgi:two-component system, cell cycle sensor histidine kinase and response regulator CckA